MPICVQELSNVRFWGKMLGLQADYYIVEAKPAHYPEEEEDTKGGCRGTCAALKLSWACWETQIR